MMALKNVLISGDCHGMVSERLRQIHNTMPGYRPEETAIILLGDVGLNYHLNKRDYIHKKEVSSYGYTIYCVRGNHEAKPGEHLGMKLVDDDFVGNPVWIDEEFPLIRYFVLGVFIIFKAVRPLSLAVRILWISTIESQMAGSGLKMSS